MPALFFAKDMATGSACLSSIKGSDWGRSTDSSSSGDRLIFGRQPFRQYSQIARLFEVQPATLQQPSAINHDTVHLEAPAGSFDEPNSKVTVRLLASRVLLCKRIAPSQSAPLWSRVHVSNKCQPPSTSASVFIHAIICRNFLQEAALLSHATYW